MKCAKCGHGKDQHRKLGFACTGRHRTLVEVPQLMAFLPCWCEGFIGPRRALRDTTP